MLSEIFWTAFITSVLGFFLIIAKLCFKSKCDQVKTCCFEIHRNTNEETDVEPTADNTQQFNTTQI